MAGLVEQIFAQASAGSANGESFYDAYLNGVQTRQNQERISLATQQMMFEQQVEQQKLGMQREALRGASELSTILAETAQKNSWTDPATRRRIFDLGSKNPSVVGSPIWKNALEQIDLAEKSKIEADRYTQQGKAVGKTADGREIIIDGNGVTVVNPIPAEARPTNAARYGELLARNQTGTLTPAEVGELEVLTPKPEGEMASIAKAKEFARLAAKVEAGTATAEERLMAQSLAPASGTTITTKDGTVVQIGGRTDIGGKAAGLTPSQTGEIIKKIDTGLRTAQQAAELSGALANKSVGIAGILGDKLIDGLGAQLGWTKPDGTRVRNRNDVIEFANNAVISFNQDTGKLSDMDRKMLAEIPPNANDWLESGPQARMKLVNIQRILAKNVIRDAKLIKQTVPVAAVRLITAEDLNDLVKQGVLLFDEALTLGDQAGLWTAP